MPPPKKKSKYWSHPKSAPPHPYIAFEGTDLWLTVKKALCDLEGNQDIELKEWHQYVVGYVCDQLTKKKLVRVKGKKKDEAPA